jgi:hypothetical protein
MPHSRSVWTKAFVSAIAAAALAGLTACLGQSKAPELVTGSEARVVIVADLDSSPKPLAESHCAQHGKRPVLRDAAPATGNLLRGWATGTKVFIYTFDCN